jgi:phosphoribosylamine--glycine ligase
MGAFSPVPFLDGPLADRIVRDVLGATVRAMAEEGVPYRGVLYAGLMLTADGPKVLEFNARFGDPETQVLVPRFATGLAAVLRASAEGGVAGTAFALRPEACVNVVAAAEGYPASPRTGDAVDGLEDAAAVEGALVFHAGTRELRGRVVTAGGRVLSVSGLGRGLAEARDRAYEAISRIAFEGMRYRGDIARSAAEEEAA